MALTLIIGFFSILIGSVVLLVGSLFVSVAPAGIAGVMTMAFGSFYAFLNIFWPLGIVLTCFEALMGIKFTIWLFRQFRIIK